MDVRLKTTGMLIDELITTLLKQNFNGTSEGAMKQAALEDEIDRVTGSEKLTTAVKLAVTNALCWFAQEDIMNESLPSENRFASAKSAQIFNRSRNHHIRTLDKLLGEDNTVLEKTY